MKTTKRFQQYVEKIASKHNTDLSKPGAYLKLEQRAYMPLVIETPGENLLSVAHYYEQNGDLIADPDVLFFTGYGDWVAIEFTMPPIGMNNGYRRYARLNADGTAITHLNIRGQADLATFVNQWGRNLKEQQWLESGESANDPTDESPSLVIDSDQPKVTVQSIEILWTESAVGEACTFDTWQAASKTIKRWAMQAPSGGSYHKTKFLVTWSDGNTYEGRLDMTQEDTFKVSPVGAWIADYWAFMAGIKRPHHMTQEHYEHYLHTCYNERVKWDAMEASYDEFLAAHNEALQKYDLGM